MVKLSGDLLKKRHLLRSSEALLAATGCGLKAFMSIAQSQAVSRLEVGLVKPGGNGPEPSEPFEDHGGGPLERLQRRPHGCLSLATADFSPVRRMWSQMPKL